MTHDIDEALKLATRVVVLAGAPAGIVGMLEVPMADKDPESSAFRSYAARLRAMIAGEPDPGGVLIGILPRFSFFYHKFIRIRHLYAV